MPKVLPEGSASSYSLRGEIRHRPRIWHFTLGFLLVACILIGASVVPIFQHARRADTDAAVSTLQNTALTVHARLIASLERQARVAQNGAAILRGANLTNKVQRIETADLWVPLRSWLITTVTESGLAGGAAIGSAFIAVANTGYFVAHNGSYYFLDKAQSAAEVYYSTNYLHAIPEAQVVRRSTRPYAPQAGDWYKNCRVAHGAGMTNAWTDVRASLAPSIRYISALVPLSNSSGQFVGCATASQDWNVRTHLLESLRSDSHRVIVFDENSRTVFGYSEECPTEACRDNDNPAEHPIALVRGAWQELHNSHDSQGSLESEDEDWLFVSATVRHGDLSLRVVTLSRYNEAYGTLYTAFRLTLILFCGFSFLAVALPVVFAALIGRALSRTIGAIRTLRKVNVTTDVVELVERITAHDFWLYELSNLMLACTQLAEYIHSQVTKHHKAVADAHHQFIKTLTHEIRTPLNGVLLALAQIKQAPAEATLAEQHELLSSAAASADILMTILNNVLDWKKLQVTDIVMSLTPVDLVALGTRVISTLEISASYKKLHVDLLLAPDCPPTVTVRGDSGRCLQVLVNLVNNAIKYTNTGCVRLIIGVEGNEGYIAVKDTGIGIPPDKIDQLFKEFRRVHEESRVPASGTGLGLCISLALLQLMKGRITCKSPAEWPDGKYGSLFTIYLPLSDGEDTRCDAEWIEKAHFVRDVKRFRRLEIPHMFVCTPSIYVADWFKEFAATFDTRVDSLVLQDAVSSPLVQVLPSQANGVLFVCSSLLHHATVATLKQHYSRCIAFGLGSGPEIEDVVPPPLHPSRVLQALLGTEGRCMRAPELPAHTAPIRVLLAEDNDIARALMLGLLTKLGHSVVGAVDGVQAVEMSRQQQFELVLMDMHMPTMDGLEATRTIRGDPTNLNVRTFIVALTADDGVADSLGTFDDFILKPCSITRLQDILAEAHTRARIGHHHFSRLYSTDRSTHSPSSGNVLSPQSTHNQNSITKARSYENPVSVVQPVRSSPPSTPASPCPVEPEPLFHAI